MPRWLNLARPQAPPTPPHGWVRRRVTSGNLAAADELPSVRALAQQHAINPMTVSKAYSLLEAEGLLERRRGTGMLVAPVRPSRGNA